MVQLLERGKQGFVELVGGCAVKEAQLYLFGMVEGVGWGEGGRGRG